jgi:hypothetical protein
VPANPLTLTLDITIHDAPVSEAWTALWRRLLSPVPHISTAPAPAPLPAGWHSVKQRRARATGSARPRKGAADGAP